MFNNEKEIEEFIETNAKPEEISDIGCRNIDSGNGITTYCEAFK